jgi:hypothetical protein
MRFIVESKRLLGTKRLVSKKIKKIGEAFVGLELKKELVLLGQFQC